MNNTPAWNDSQEWLEADGLGGFASGTIGGIRTRRYHGLLLVATNPPAGRVMLVNGVEVYVTTPAGTFPLSSQRYDGQVVHPEGFKCLRDFRRDPWPKWTYGLPDGTRIERELVIRHETPIVLLSWRVIGRATGIFLTVRPLMSGRDYHTLHQENAQFNFSAEQSNGHVRWQPYAAHPAIVAHSNGKYAHGPLWYRRFFYQEEWLRGFPASEDLASPGEFRFELGEASLGRIDATIELIRRLLNTRRQTSGVEPRFVGLAVTFENCGYLLADALFFHSCACVRCCVCGCPRERGRRGKT